MVIYSIDARGLVASTTDASSPTQFDPQGRLERSSMGEVSAAQDGLHALAADTGGKAFFNSNALEPALKRALSETSTYYLLAWKPDLETNESKKFHRIEVKVPGRSNLTLQVRRGFFDIEPAPTSSTSRESSRKPPPQVSPQSELTKVMNNPFPERELPISLRLNFMNVPVKGSVLSASMQVPHEFFTFAPVNGKETAVVEVAGSFFNAKGQPGARFSNRINVTSADPNGKGEDLVYSHPVFLSPGLYHVRVAARDETSGRSRQRSRLAGDSGLVQGSTNA